MPLPNSNIASQVAQKGHVTFQNRVFMGGILFKINTQWPFDMIVWLNVGCGCSGGSIQQVKHYRVLASGNALLIDARYVVETTVPIPECSQDFDVARRDQHLYPGKNFQDIVGNPDPTAMWNRANNQAIDKFKH